MCKECAELDELIQRAESISSRAAAVAKNLHRQRLEHLSVRHGIRYEDIPVAPPELWRKLRGESAEDHAPPPTSAE